MLRKVFLLWSYRDTVGMKWIMKGSSRTSVLYSLTEIGRNTGNPKYVTLC